MKARTVVGVGLYLAATGVLFLIPDENLRLTRALLVSAMFLVITGFCVSYQVLTRGHWRDTEHGWHIMTFSAAFALISGFLVLALFGFLPTWLQPILGAWIYLTVLSLFMWRYFILRRGQRVPRGQAPEPDPEDQDDQDDYVNGYPPKA